MRATKSLVVGSIKLCGHGLARQGGFSLVELMVSLVISLLISVAALGSARMFMGAQRQSVGAGTASGNAVTTIESIKHEAEQAGLGFYVNSTLPCQSFNLSTGTTTLVANAHLMPISISKSNGNLAQLDVLYASALESAAPAYLASPTSSSDTVASLTSNLPVQTGQSVMLTPLGDSGLPCTVKTATSVDAPLPGMGPVLHFDDTGLHNKVDFSGFTYSAKSAVSLLGTLTNSPSATTCTSSSALYLADLATGLQLSDSMFPAGIPSFGAQFNTTLTARVSVSRLPSGAIMVTTHQSDNSTTSRRLNPFGSGKATKTAWKSVLR